MKDIVVLGLGNPLMSDEGIGKVIIDRLADFSDKYTDADFIDAGTGGFSMLHYISSRKKAVIIDCAIMGTEPGTIKRFTPDEVKSVKQLTHQSLHEADILKIIELAKKLGQCPDEIVIFGIEPARIEPANHLSDTLAARVDEYLNLLRRELSI